MVQMMPYILPLLLGRTFDLDKMQVGVDIFSKDVIDNPVIIQNPVTRNKYKIVDSTVEARDLLDVEGSFSLNVKAGIFKAGASGQYLADTYNRENTVEVAITSAYETQTEQIPDDAKPIPMWKRLGGALGTHYVRSITYGGELIAAVRMTCKSTRDKQKIKASLEIGGRIEIFDLSVQVEAEYEKDFAKTVENTQIKIYSSVPLSKAPNDMDTLKEGLEVFPEDLKNFNGGKGVPLKMELWPLDLLDSSIPARIKNRALDAELDTFEEKFDDLENTKIAIYDWMKVMVQPLTESQEKKIGEFYGEAEKTIRTFYDVIGKLDMTKGIDQLKPALDAYGQNIPGTFYKKYLRLRQEIAKDQGQEWTLSRGNGAIYTHWGVKNCSVPSESLYSGVALGPHMYGGGANFLCVPNNPALGKKITEKKDSAVLQGMSYRLPNDVKSQLLCSTCRLGARGSVEMFVGRTECPSGWDYIYDGELSSGSLNSGSTRFICLDKKADTDTKFLSKSPVVPDWAIMPTDNKNNDDDDDENHMLFVCVVCAK